jgi:hypothetical protein
VTWISAAVLALCGATVAPAADPRGPRDVLSFGNLQSPTPEAARQRAKQWLDSVGKADEATLAKFNAVWDSDRTLLDKVTETFVLGDPQAAALLKEARDTSAPAPEKVPAILKDTKIDPYYRSNLALAYARALANRKVYGEAREALQAVKPDQVVDPGCFFFTKALCEYTLMMKNDADNSIARLLEDVSDAPERYRMVAALMHFDMLSWQDKDLGWVARKMGVIRDRLEIERAGKETQRIQKEVLVRLDEMIKELENQKKRSGGS